MSLSYSSVKRRRLGSILKETAPYREDEEKVNGVVVADKGQFTKQNMDAVEINAPDPPQNEESIVSAVEICRVCLLGNLVMRDLFVQNEVDSLSAKVMSFANVKIMPGDGLPGRVCCMCADKLESAYELKLQVEQADSVLRERFDGINIKEELFFNEVEVHLDVERNDGIGDIHVQDHYDTPSACVNLKSEDEKSTLLKDQLTLLQVEKFAEQEQLQNEQHEMDVINEEMHATANSTEIKDNKESLKMHNMTVANADAIPTEEHDYIMQQSCMLPTGEEHLQEEHLQEALQEEHMQEDDLQEEHEDHMQEEHLQEDHLQEDHLQEDHMQEDHLQEDHMQEDHLQEVHMQEDHMQEDHLHEDHLQEDHLQEDHLQEDHLQEEHLQEEHMQEEHMQEEHLQEEHMQEEHMQEEHLQEEHLQEEHLQEEHLQEQLQEEHLQQQLQEGLQEEHLREQLQEEQLQEEHLQEQLHEHLQEQLQEEPEEDHQEQGHEEEGLQETPQAEARRSKRKSARRTFTTDRDSDEENYFENLNLSSRLKKVQADRSEKVFFMCYLCDKQFLSKSVLKEHMHSHEEVRRTLSLKKTPEKSQKTPSGALPTKMPPSGKRANKCPYCGKEYLYIISFSKHLKQHEREREESKEDPMPLEISFHEDEHSLDFEQSQYLDAEGKRRPRKEETTEDDDAEEQSGSERRKKTRTEEFACNKCSEKFPTRRALRKHTLTHVSLTCSVCEEEFDTLEKLRDHRAKHVVEGVLTDQDLEEDAKIVEKGEAEYEDGEKDEEDDEEDEEVDEDGKDKWAEKDLKCPNCPMTYSHKKSLSRHMETHSGTKYSCKVCCQQFTRKDHLRRHSEHHGRVKSYKCTQCNKTFGNELTLRNHLIATNHKTFVHGQEYDPNKRIKRHAAKAAQKIIDKIKTEDGLEDYDDDDNNDSVELDNRYSRKRDGMPKKYNCKKELECATCNKRCSSKQSLTKHMEQHVKDEKAEKAEKMDKNKKQPEKKEQRGLGDDDDDDDNSDFESGLDWPMDNHECTTCKKRYSTKKSLLRHQLLHEEPNFECDICNVKFYRKDKLKAHYDKCSEKNPDQVRKCNICGDSFENNEMLREHRAKHVTEGILTEEDLRDIEPRPEEKKQGEKIARKRRTDIVGLECTECNKQYTSRKGLLRHIQVHEGKKYLCDICPKKFYRREHLKIHVAKHNMIRPYKCTRCTKRFIKEEQLTNHLSKHDRTFKKNKETDSSKRFLCEICSKSFTQSTTLIAHLRAHNGIKPYVCEVCSRPFTTNAYLKMHMRTHTQERPYICQYCSRAFARADTLANHLTSHTGEAKYHCKYCPKNFRRLKSLKEHVFIHTGQRPYACPTCDRRFNNNGSRYAHSKRCKQNLLQNQTRTQTLTQVQAQPQQRVHQTLTQAQVVKAQNIKTITITRQDPVQQVVQHQEILMPLILPLTVTLTDVGEEVILPEGTKIFTTS